jgi:hypothetical protein
LVGYPADELDRCRKLAGVDQQIISQPEILQPFHAPEEIGTQEEPVVRFVLDDVADPDESRVAGESLEVAFD